MGKNPAQKLKTQKPDKKAEAAAEKAVSKKAKATDAESKEVKAAHHAHHASTKSRADMHCKMTGCKREYKAKGYCREHYRQWRHGKFGQARYKCCGDLGCFKPQVMNRHGYCEEHFQNYYVKGIAVAKPVVPTAAKPAAKAADEQKAAS